MKHKAKTKSKGGLCLYLKKKHHWSEKKFNTCVKNSKKKHGRKRKSRSVNPWAVCHAQGLKGRKFERCVLKVKKQR